MSIKVLLLLSYFVSYILAAFQERVSAVTGRRLYHTHVHSAPLYGNSTDLEYFYVNVRVGSQQQEQALIVDTGSGIIAMPCAGYCTSCGKHINAYFDIDASTSQYIHSCSTD